MWRQNVADKPRNYNTGKRKVSIFQTIGFNFQVNTDCANPGWLWLVHAFVS